MKCRQTQSGTVVSITEARRARANRKPAHHDDEIIVCTRAQLINAVNAVNAVFKRVLAAQESKKPRAERPRRPKS